MKQAQDETPDCVCIPGTQNMPCVNILSPPSVIETKKHYYSAKALSQQTFKSSKDSDQQEFNDTSDYSAVYNQLQKLKTMNMYHKVNGY